jgi:hypothetical protein
MKKVLFITLLIIFVSCKNEGKTKINVSHETVVKDEFADLYGNWVGDFVSTKNDSMADETDYVVTNKINLVIKKIENNKAYGQSIVAGNSRPLVGSFSEYNGEYRFTLKEPGDERNDGKFSFTIVKHSNKEITLEGKWLINNKEFPVWEREYKLVKQPFKYNPKVMLPEEGEYVDWFSVKIDSSKYTNDDGTEETYYDDSYRSASDIITKLNASTTLLKESDVKNLKKLELEIIRNTIFARHGYTFKKKSFRQFFDPVTWYIPVTDDMSGKLTYIEQKNIVLLNRFQKYAEDNYDSFGR